MPNRRPTARRKALDPGVHLRRPPHTNGDARDIEGQSRRGHTTAKRRSAKRIGAAHAMMRLATH